MALIDQQEALDALNEYFCRISKLKRRGLNKGEKAISLDVAGAIQSLPTKVICCKDCKHWNLQVGNVKGDGLGSCDFHNVNLVTGEGFCYWAENRGEADGQE